MADDVLRSEDQQDPDVLADRLELLNVQIVRWSGGWLDDPTDFETAVFLDDISAELRGHYRFVGDSLLQCRWSADVPLREADGRNVANIEVALVESFSVDAGPVPSSQALSLFMKDAALRIALPYLREALQNMSQKLGIGSIVIGIVHDSGEGAYTAASIKRWAQHAVGPATLRAIDATPHRPRTA